MCLRSSVECFELSKEENGSHLRSHLTTRTMTMNDSSNCDFMVISRVLPNSDHMGGIIETYPHDPEKLYLDAYLEEHHHCRGQMFQHSFFSCLIVLHDTCLLL